MKRHAHSLFAAALMVAGFFLIVPAHAVAQRRGAYRSDYLKTNPDFKKAFRKVIDQARKSTVLILDDKKKVALGTIVDSEGLLITKASKIGETPIVKLADGRELQAKVLARHKDHDLALIKIDATDLTPAQFKPSKETSVGYWAVSAGTVADPIALGVISVAMRKIAISKQPFPLQKAYLGVMLSPAESGAKIEQVMPKTGASRAGVRANDVILSIAGKMVKDADTVRRALSGSKPGDTVKMRILRGEREIDVELLLGERPASRGETQNRMGSKLSDRTDGFPVILQHDSIVLPEECGGPLVDLDGKVIGINIARAGRTESYAVPTEVVLPLINEMRQGKHNVSTKKKSNDPK